MNIIKLSMSKWHIKTTMPFISLGRAGENNSCQILFDVDKIMESNATSIVAYFLDIYDNDNATSRRSQLLDTDISSLRLFTTLGRQFLGKQGIKTLQVRCIVTDRRGNELRTYLSNKLNVQVEAGYSSISHFDSSIILAQLSDRIQYLTDDVDDLRTHGIPQDVLKDTILRYFSDNPIDTLTEDEVNEIISIYVTNHKADMPKGDKGDKGDNGQDAYELAVEKGFVGTQEQWLESLHGTNGKDGKNGADGKTPIKGTDYWTQEEVSQVIQNIVNDIKTYILNNKADFKGQDGVIGHDGKSAYDIALENGFSGDKTAWLESLKGDDGLSSYEIAVKNGFVGTEQEFIASLKGKQGNVGKQGESGKSAYQIAVDNGFTGTEQEWLESLKGNEYDDTELQGEITNLQKIQDRTGIKNLLPFPYENLSGGYSGVLFNSQADGKVLVNGTGNYSHLSLFSNFVNTKLKEGDYILSLELENYANLEGTLGFQVQFTDRRTSPTTTIRKRITCTKTTPKAEALFTITEDLINGINNGSVDFNLILYSSSNGVTATDVKMLPMIRFANDVNDTWTPFAMSNVKLTLRTNEIEQYTDYVTPEMFGAIGDGIVDDSAAFTLAVTKASTLGKRLYLPNKYYLASKITCGAVHDNLVIEGQSVFNRGYDDTNEKSVIIAEGGFELSNCVAIKGVKFKTYGIQIIGNRNNIKNCTFYNCNKGIKLTSTGNTWHGEVILNNNFFDGCTIGIDFVMDSTNNRVYTDCIIRNNIFVYGEIGINGNASGNLISGNHIYSNKNIVFSGENNSIIGNYFDQNGTLLDIGCWHGFTNIHDNIFYKTQVNKDSNNNSLPICIFHGNSDAVVSFTGNSVNFEGDSESSDLVFIKVTGNGSLGVLYGNNVCKFNFIDLGNGHLYSSENSSLAPIIGEYLPISSSNSNKKRSVEVGATNTQFYVGAFVDKYGITSVQDLNFEVSAETSSGNVVAYNRVAVNWSSKAVYIYFDELTEQTTFICKCSAIK